MVMLYLHHCKEIGMDSVQRSNTQEVVVQLTPQDAKHIIRFLGWIAHPTLSDRTITLIDRDNARHLMHYLQTVYEVNGYIGGQWQ